MPNCFLELHYPDTLDLLAEFDMKRYRLQRRLLGPIYQASNLKKFEAAIDAVLARYIATLHSIAGKEELDLKEWMHILVVECLGEVVLSSPLGYLKDSSDGGSSDQSYLGWKRKSVFGLFPAAVALENLSKDFGRAWADLWDVTYVLPPGKFRPFFSVVHKKISGRLKNALGPRPPKEERVDLLGDLIRLYNEKAEFKEIYLRRMAITNFGAGHETTTSALTSVFAMIGSHADFQARIALEIGETTDAIAFDDAARLDYTQAAIKEAQRLYPVIGMSLPRRVPTGGVTIGGYHIPVGTTVGCNPVSLHRNPDIFGDDADSFDPGRWLDAGEGKGMDRYNLTWGGGARTCPGRNLAQLILWKAVPALVREFDVQATNLPGDRDITFYFMAMLTGVRVRFVPRAKTVFLKI
jgi:cytochrome P450